MVLTFCWVIYGPICILTVLIFEYSFILYNYYGQQRTLTDHLLYCFPIFSDQMISFYYLNWRLIDANDINLKQGRKYDVIDWIQGWYIAYRIWNIPRLLYALKLKPQCDCDELLQEYWTPLKQIKEMERKGRESLGKLGLCVCVSWLCISAHFVCIVLCIFLSDEIAFVILCNTFYWCLCEVV